MNIPDYNLDDDDHYTEQNECIVCDRVDELDHSGRCYRCGCEDADDDYEPYDL